MKKILLSVCVFCLCLCGYAKSNENRPFDFRSVNWGMSRSEVFHAEDSWIFNREWSDEYMLIYDIAVGDYIENVTYFFDNNVLVLAVYYINDKYLESSCAYDALAADLTAKYGKSTKMRQSWVDDFIASDPKDWYGWRRDVDDGLVQNAPCWVAGDTHLFIMDNGYTFGIYYAPNDRAAVIKSAIFSLL